MLNNITKIHELRHIILKRLSNMINQGSIDLDLKKKLLHLLATGISTPNSSSMLLFYNELKKIKNQHNLLYFQLKKMMDLAQGLLELIAQLTKGVHFEEQNILQLEKKLLNAKTASDYDQCHSFIINGVRHYYKNNLRLNKKLIPKNPNSQAAQFKATVFIAETPPHETNPFIDAAEWIFKLEENQSQTPRLKGDIEIIAQEFFRLICGSTQPVTLMGMGKIHTDLPPTQGALLKSADTSFGLISERVSNFKDLRELLENPEHKGDLTRLKQKIASGSSQLGTILVTALWLGEIDLRPENIGIDDKGSLVKIDGELSLMNVRIAHQHFDVPGYLVMTSNKKVEVPHWDISTSDIDNLPFPGKYKPFHLLDIIEGGIAMPHSQLFDQTLRENPLFREEVNNALFNIISLSDHHITAFVAGYASPLDPHFNDIVSELIKRRQQLEKSALGNRSFRTWIGSPAADQSATLFRVNAQTFQTSTEKYPLRTVQPAQKLRLLRRAVQPSFMLTRLKQGFNFLRRHKYKILLTVTLITTSVLTGGATFLGGLALGLIGIGASAITASAVGATVVGTGALSASILVDKVKQAGEKPPLASAKNAPHIPEDKPLLAKPSSVMQVHKRLGTPPQLSKEEQPTAEIKSSSCSLSSRSEDDILKPELDPMHSDSRDISNPFAIG